MRFSGRDRILVAKMRYIGDVLLITPFLRALRKGFPGAHIEVVVNKGTEDVLLNNPHIDGVIPFDREMGKLAQYSFTRGLKKKNFQTVIDLSNSDRSAWIARFSGAYDRVGIKGAKSFRNKHLYNMLIDIPEDIIHEVERNLLIAKRLGLRRLTDELVLNLTDDELLRGSELTSEIKGSPYAVIHPGARRWYKSWPMERFAELADEIIESGVEVVIAGGENDIENASKIISLMKGKALNLAGRTSIRELAAVIKGAVFFVGNDSAPMHISYTVKTVTIALFGPTDFRRWHPVGDAHFVFAKDIECSPCGHSKDCELGDDTCMRLISVLEVAEAVHFILDEKGIKKAR